MKKRLVLLLSLAFVSVFNSCKTIDEWTQFTMEYDQETTIEATIPIPIGLLNIPTPDITTNSESRFASENTRKDMVEDAKLTKLTLTVLAPNGGDFSFLESAKVYISADGLDEIMVASNTDVPALATISLDSEGQNLEAYIKKEEIILRVETVTDEILTQDYDIKIHSEFYIDAKILGI